MELLSQFAQIAFLIQIFHSLEEIFTGFHKKWYLTKIPFWLFVTFEVCFTLFWGWVLFNPEFPNRENLLAFFLILMFANGIQHIVWFGWAKKYIPGLITAPIHVIIFLIFYFKFVGL